MNLPDCSFCGSVGTGIHAMTPGLKPCCHACYKKIKAKRDLENVFSSLSTEEIKSVFNEFVDKQEKKD